MVPRELTAVLQSGLETQVDPTWYVKADGSLDMEGLLSAFQGYFREDAKSWVVSATGTPGRGRNWYCVPTCSGW